MSEYLAHHGIKNQKWGQRRFQNLDGSLTPEGRMRYGVGEAQTRKTVDSSNESTKSSSSETGSEKRSATTLTPSELFEHRAEYSNEELRSAMERIKIVNELEKLQLEDMQNKSKISKETKTVDNSGIRAEIQNQKDQNDLEAARRSGEEAARQGEIKKVQQENEMLEAKENRFKKGLEKADRARKIIAEINNYGDTLMGIYDMIATMTGNDTIEQARNRKALEEKNERQKLENKKKEAEEQQKAAEENKKQAQIAKAKAQSDFDKYSKELEGKDAEIKGLEASRNTLKEEREKLVKTQETNDGAIERERKKLQNLEATGKKNTDEYAETEKLVKGYEAAAKGIKAALKSKDDGISDTDKAIKDANTAYSRISEKADRAAEVTQFFKSNSTASVYDMQIAFDKYAIANGLLSDTNQRPQLIGGGGKKK